MPALMITANGWELTARQGRALACTAAHTPPLQHRTAPAPQGKDSSCSAAQVTIDCRGDTENGNSDHSNFVIPAITVRRLM